MKINKETNNSKVIIGNGNDIGNGSRNRKCY